MAFIGTSGWAYRHWKESWYGGLPARSWLQHNTERFTALEANGTHYRLPSRESLEKWAAAVPEGFRFTMKAHRYLTHQKRLSSVAEGIRKQREAALGLGEKLSCVVWQLPSRFSADIPRLISFLEELAAWPETRHAIEFRHESWFNDVVARLLQDARVANCISDAESFPRWDAVTTDLVYVRLHGRPHTYWSDYPPEELERWADRCRAWEAEGREVHVYFDNDANGHAPWNALSLIERLGTQIWNFHAA